LIGTSRTNVARASLGLGWGCRLRDSQAFPVELDSRRRTCPLSAWSICAVKSLKLSIHLLKVACLTVGRYEPLATCMRRCRSARPWLGSGSGSRRLGARSRPG
jgi:hypothetical protein